MYRQELDLVTTLLVLGIGLTSAVLLLADLVRQEVRGFEVTDLGLYARYFGLGLAAIFGYVVFFRFDLLGT